VRISRRPRVVEIGGSRVELARTTDGVIRLTGDDDVALAAGLGVAHAHDRMVQMMLVRLVGQGRLGECLAADDQTLAIDLFARGMGFRRDAEADVANLGGDALRFASAYAAGVNWYLERQRRPVELVLAGYRPEPWTVADTLLTIKLIGYIGLAQTQQDFEKLLVEAIRDGVSVAMLKRLVAPHLDGLDRATVELIRQLAWIEPLLDPAVRFSSPSLKASNGWAVAGARTASGSPIACYDPHLEVNRLPAVWYEAVMRTADDWRIGITMPGIPGLVMGRNRRLAFGFTYGFMDMIDYFIEECRGGKCRRGESWSEVEVRREVVGRRRSQPLQISIRETSHGVLEADPLNPELPDGLYLARAWSNHRSSGAPSLEALLRAQSTHSVPEAQRVLRRVTLSCNWVLADADGNIGYQQSGRLPKRSHSGLYPAAGWDDALAWRGTVDSALLHAVLNPEAGFVASANELINPPGGPLVVNLPMGSYRADRIRDVLGGTPSATIDDMQRLQLDLYSRHAERFMGLIRPLLPDSPAARLLASWDLRYDRASRGATLFEEVYHRLLARVFGDGLFGPEAWHAIATSTTILADYSHLFDDAVLGGDPGWFGESGREATLKAVLEEVLGDRSEATAPRWGDRQRASMTNLFFSGRLPRWLGFDVGPIPLEGCRATVVQGALFDFHGHTTTFGPSWRCVTDLGSDAAHTVLAGGPSGRRSSRWYRSDVGRWLSGGYKVLRGGDGDR
jgi:penicillin amidase